MSLRANYYKLGLFVIGAVASGVAILLIVGSGRWFTPRLTVETYFNESVQGLDIGSKLKYRGVVIGDVTRITFTYTQYQLERQMSDPEVFRSPCRDFARRETRESPEAREFRPYIRTARFCRKRRNR